MSALFRTFDVTLTVQTALHIGDGTKLLRDVDWVYEHGQARVIAVDRPLDLMEPIELDRARDGAIASALGQARREQVTKAVLPVYRFGDETAPNEVLTLIRDADGKPYVPGSSLKGAIRTALLRTLLRSPANGGYVRQLQSSPRGFSAARLENELLRTLSAPGRSAEPQNRDVLRLVRVSDLRPRGDPPVAFVPVTVRSVDTKREVLTVWSECILRPAGFRGTISIDQDLAERLGADAGLIARLEGAIRSDTEALLREAAAWAGEPFGAWAEAAAGACLAVLGWGTGWLAHTVGPLIPAGERRRLARELRIGRPAGDNVPFPRSVKVGAVDDSLFGGRGGTAFAVPMGIVRLEFRERQ